jgi:hypothetical protein
VKVKLQRSGITGLVPEETTEAKNDNEKKD